jgi:hypothetical protein
MVFSRVRITWYLALCVCFVDRCLSFCPSSFDHCVVCYSSIYRFVLPRWYLQALRTDKEITSHFVTSKFIEHFLHNVFLIVLLHFVFFFCLSLIDLQLPITYLISSHFISIFRFRKTKLTNKADGVKKQVRKTAQNMQQTKH